MPDPCPFCQGAFKREARRSDHPRSPFGAYDRCRFLNSSFSAINLGPVCTNGTPYTVGLDGGLSGATNPTQRKMTQGTAFVLYGLYRDAARSQAFGNTIGTNTAAGTGTGLSQTLTVYGRVAPQATPAPGTYTDTITATLTY